MEVPFFFLSPVGPQSMRTRGKSHTRELCMSCGHDRDCSLRDDFSELSQLFFQSEGKYKGWGQWLGQHLICIKHHVPSISLSHHLWEHGPITMLLAQCLIAMQRAEGKLLQGTASRVILERRQASRPTDSLHISSSREQGTFYQGEGVIPVTELGENCQTMVYRLPPLTRRASQETTLF